MSQDDELEVVPAAEEPEEPETPEGDEPEEPELPADEPEEDLEQVRKDAKAFKDQQSRANKAEDFLRKAGLDPKTGKPKESRAPNKDGKALSDEDNNRIAKSEERSERAEARSLGYTHPDDIEYLRKQAHKNFDGDLQAAADDEFVKNKLERTKATRDTKDATPPPNRRSGSSRSTKLPDFSKMSNAEFDKWERENRA
jgi:hypothetical protein